MLIVSSSNENPVAAFTELYQQQKKMESQSYPKWLTPHVYCWHVLLHDVVAGNAKRSVMESLYLLHDCWCCVGLVTRLSVSKVSMVLLLVTCCRSTQEHHHLVQLRVFQTHGVNFSDTNVTLCVP